MHGPDGKDWPNFTRYHEVEPRAKLVYDHGASSAEAKPLFRVTATFTDLGGRTELDMHMTLESAEAAAQSRTFVRAAGGNGTWDRLAEFLEKQTSNTDVFVINRSFETDIATMFDLWTTPEHFGRWLPPAGMTMHFQRIDVRTGGEGFYSMGNADFTMYGKIAYTRIERPHLLQYTQCFTDARENLSRHPMAPLWPAYMHTTGHGALAAGPVGHARGDRRVRRGAQRHDDGVDGIVRQARSAHRRPRSGVAQA
jgi:uncharacterized protein YndB with AHSA1/START domain